MMGFDPQRFFIGMLDFFSILLPGLIVAFVVREGRNGPLASAYPDLEGTSELAFFLVLSYLLGHFVFLLGATLDSTVYEPLRRATPVLQERLKNEDPDGFTPAKAWVRFLSRRIIGTAGPQDLASQQAMRLRDQHLGAAARAVNAFQWSKARLLIDKPEALARVERFEADSKFFRSLVVLFAVLTVVFAITGRWLLTVIVLAMMVMAFWRYADQRLKATTYAFWYVLMLHADR